jgi:DNA-binding NarL/FixJ family response regulator
MRIILADHHDQSRSALETLFAEQPEFDLVGQAIDAQGLILLVEKHTPDLVLLDGELPGTSIEELIAALHTFKARLIVMVMSSKFENSRMLLRAGADAFVSKTDEPEWLLEKLTQYAKQVKKDDANRNSSIRKVENVNE